MSELSVREWPRVPTDILEKLRAEDQIEKLSNHLLYTKTVERIVFSDTTHGWEWALEELNSKQNCLVAELDKSKNLGYVADDNEYTLTIVVLR